MESWQAIFSGEVQGVGFRYTASHLANSLGVSGWVSNLPDGTVELVASGTESQKLINTLKEKFECDVAIKKIPAENYSGFEIR